MDLHSRLQTSELAIQSLIQSSAVCKYSKSCEREIVNEISWYVFLLTFISSFQDRLGNISGSRSPDSASVTSDLQPQPPYFPPPPGLGSVLGLSQEQQTLFNSLPVSLASLQPSASSLSSLPASNDSFQVNTNSLQSFSTGQQRRLTQDSASPLSLVSEHYIIELKTKSIFFPPASLGVSYALPLRDWPEEGASPE